MEDLNEKSRQMDELLRADVSQKCPECRGHGADPLSDNLNWRPCRSCVGTGTRRVPDVCDCTPAEHAAAMGEILPAVAWQTIDTAPKDGTKILLAKIVGHADHDTALWWAVLGFWSDRWQNWNDGFEPCGLAGPTHWAPISARGIGLGRLHSSAHQSPTNEGNSVSTKKVEFKVEEVSRYRILRVESDEGGGSVEPFGEFSSRERADRVAQRFAELEEFYAKNPLGE